MGKRKKKSVFTPEEKELIRSLKNELKMMGVPREEWSRQIQQELTFRRSMRQDQQSGGSKSGFGGFLQKIWQKIVGWFFKLSTRNLQQDQEMMDEFYKMFEQAQQPSEEEKKLMEMFSPNVQFDDVDALGKGGATVGKKSDKKRMIVEFDDED
ncbi:MAG: hypothetical protein GF317_05180 [Candidatus Lokiarchaeota archaeon]|nr:hypothetical protein [Candidatus Lokiarchaeota archaeon]MBD3199199.1 hypothetical protein [Candidatus Lokiarchaeota archaeon]